MGSIAERPKLRAAAATQRNGAASRVDLTALVVAEGEGASDHQRAILVRNDLDRLFTHSDLLPPAGWAYADVLGQVGGLRD
jgi:hypothetical protein